MKFYGYLGLLLMVLVEINFVFQVEPFATWYIPIMWYGFILFVDALVLQKAGKSLISDNKLFSIILISIPVWSVYEFFNFVINNWFYVNYPLIVHLVDFTIILPALLEARDLFLASGWFKKSRVKRFRASSKQLSWLFLSGFFCLVLPLIYPCYFFWMMWLAPFFLLDPVNYLLGYDSFISDWKKGRFNRFLSAGLGGLFCGFFWEFWNYWAVPKWFYTIPLVNFWHIFELPLLGYLGYIPFAWSMYDMYVFVKNLF